MTIAPSDAAALVTARTLVPGERHDYATAPDVHPLPNLIALVSDARIAMAEALRNAENVLEAEFTIEEHEDVS